MARRFAAAAAVALVALLACIAVEARKDSISQPLYRNRNLLGFCTYNQTFCSAVFNDCFIVGCAPTGNGNLTISVTPNTTATNPICKKSNSYSWAACNKIGTAKTACGTLITCDGTPVSSGYCNSVNALGSGAAWEVTSNTTSVGLQLHDGQFQDKGTDTCPATSTTDCFAGSNNCDTCELPYTIPDTCRYEDDSNSQEFETDPQRVTNRLFLGVGGCIAKPSGTYTFTDPLTNAATTAPLYPLTSGTPLHTFLATATAGQTGAIACYTNTSYTVVQKYLFIESIATGSDNFACLTCSWFRVYTVTKPTNCRCGSDTAWAFPLKSVLTSWTAGQAASTTEIGLPAASYPGGVWWQARQETAQAWGGFFRIAPALSNPNRVSTTRTLVFDMCAGCAMNQIGKGYIMGKVNFTFTSVNGSTSTMMFYEPAPGASTTSAVLQVYQSYAAPTSLTPGQFKSFSPYSTPTLPFGYGATWGVTRLVTGTIANGPTVIGTVPTAMTASGVYLAIHMSVGGAFCDGTPPYN
ncbi:hypothetical protein HXX76_006835 [Chlamydomonas incerta]|uniref:Membrane-associated protein n=1 Tax=Chlamydomonas incerta TaxID=51695 RepID=A0A835T254_CHLIN|nr:hypothetical protein HXX76_006835 [Chlamydomonas incerta]|eukprot:KAG2435632.1 hypothetical protein HXX76_006835 [Chlamydomonas incerta]